MGFFKRNRWPLIIGGVTALSIILLALAPYALPAIAAPVFGYFVPYVLPVFSYIAPYVAPALVWLGIPLSFTSIWFTAATVGALVFGAIAGLFTKAVNSFCCTPEASKAIENNQPQNISNNLAQEEPLYEHQTNQQARTYNALNVIPVCVGDATQTTNGPESNVVFKTNTGEVIATATWNHYTKKYKSDWDPLNTLRQTDESEQELMPIYKK